MKQEFIKTAEGTLIPLEQSKAFEALGAGETIVLQIKRQRNPKYHRLAFSWFKSIFDNTDIWETFDQMRYNLTTQAGFIKCQYVDVNSQKVTCDKCGHIQQIDIERVTVQPESLAFESMDEDKFRAVTTGIDQVLQSRYGVNIEIGMH